ncbi:GDP-mannose 4,6-dehydratase [Chitinophaga pendula]|uniref:NAD-dependent epimerase/dehydratase family protein n=1 Tax=Chitinophaga TaxID=79328 RepID=UPI000BAF29F8|nr:MULTISPECIES: NAD-dependent epimerase/dehydratase family protein [Chitinophaga]ASZ12693.1 epimerase [Chitinophaga sp. MD30]UCJ09695.1 GDP-mannose 4,6-dehydratase [Chitinophaga pendula]
MRPKILITGGAGFIGSYLCEQLYNKGYEITVLDNLAPQIHGEDNFQSSLYLRVKDIVRFVYGDIRDEALLQEVVAGQDYIVHLAAETSTGKSMYEMSRYTDVNITGTTRLLEAASLHKDRIQKIVVASSRAIYGEGKYRNASGHTVFPGMRKAAQLSAGIFDVLDPVSGHPLELVATSEDTIKDPSSIYGITKQSQEQLVMVGSKSLGIPAVALRFQNVYGPGQSLRNPYTGVLSTFSTRIRNGKDLNIFEDGLESRDFVYVSDVVQSIILALECDQANDEVFNVGTGVPITLLKVASLLEAAFGIEVPMHVSGNYRVGDIRHNYADLTKIREALGFVPTVPFEEGIRHFVAWVKEEPIAEDRYERSIHELIEKGLYR